MKKGKDKDFKIFIVKSESGGLFQFTSIVNVLAMDMKTVADQYPSATSIDEAKGNIVVRPEVAKIICRQLRKSKKK